MRKTRYSLYEHFIYCWIASYEHVENDASYHVALDGDTLTIYFQCSNGKLDWRHNFMFPAKPYRDMKNLWFCHRGFLKVWKSIEPYLYSKIVSPNVKRVVIVGYSHGAAIAQLCHEYVKFNRPDVDVTGFGFGAPRVFWGPCRRVVKDRFDGFYVIRNGLDAVTFLPPALFGFRHICKVIKVGHHWSFKDFVRVLKSSGWKEAFSKHTYLGVIKDHYPERYTGALQQYESVAWRPSSGGSNS